MIKQLERATRARLDAIMRGLGVTTLQYTALSALAAQPGIASAQLARQSFVSPQAANEMVGALERKGMLERRARDGNRRELALHLTGAGRRTLARCDASMDSFEAELLGDLSQAEHERLRKLLRTCLRAIEAPESGE